MASFFEHIGSEVESVADAAALASKIAAEAAQVAAEAARDSAASSASDASNSEATVTASQNAAAASATSSASSAATSTTKAAESASSSATSSTKAAESAASAATATTKASEASASAATATTKAAEATSARDDITGLTASTGAAGSSASYNSSTGVLSVPRGDTGAQGPQGIQGPAGQDSTVAGPQGPAGQDSTVAGPQGPAGQDSTVAGPQGNQGIQGVQGLAGSDGSDGTQFDTNVLKVDGTNNRVGINDTTPSVSLDAGSNTDAIAVPVGTTAQRPADGAGRFRYNSTTQAFEGYTTEWGSIAGGGGTNTFTTDSFTANGSTTAYALSQVVSSEGSLLVFIDGVFQTQDAYSIATASGATTLTFSAAPANNRKIVVYSVAAAVSGSNLNIDSMTGDGSDVTLTLSIAPVNLNNTIVTIDGVYQSKSNYSVSGTTLTFSTAPPSGSAVEVMTFTQTEINVPVDNTVTSAKLSGALTTPSDLTVTGALTVDTNTLVVDATNNRVGINNSSPVEMLTVGSTSDTNVRVQFLSSTTGGNTIQFGDGTGAGAYSGYINYTHSDDVLAFATGGSERMRILGGSVGIGTSSPDTGLDCAITNYTFSGTNYDVYGLFGATSGGIRLGADSSNGDSVIGTTGTNDLQFVTYNGSSWGSRMTLNNTGNVGIGMTPSAWHANWTALQLGATGFVGQYQAGATDITALGSNVFSDGAYKYLETDEAVIYKQQNGEHIFDVAASGSANAAISWTTALTINNSGSVNIGSGASISSDADADNLVIQENGAAGITIGSSASSVGSIRFADSGSPRAGMIYYNHVGNEMRFYTNATEHLRISAVGGISGTMLNADNGEYVGNLNDLKKTGFYRSRNTNSNNPSVAYYSVIVYGNQSNVTAQIATLLSGPATYVRSFNTSWTSWVRIDD